MNLPKLNFETDFNFRLKQQNGRLFIYDFADKQWLALTPEEWVRQHWAYYFHFVKGIAFSALVKEKKIEINGAAKRIDLLVTEKTSPKILLELKAPQVNLTEKTFEQAARYNSVIGAPKILLSNGLQHIYGKFSDEKYHFFEWKF